jgi:hypothetical protein
MIYWCHGHLHGGWPDFLGILVDARGSMAIQSAQGGEADILSSAVG